MGLKEVPCANHIEICKNKYEDYAINDVLSELIITLTKNDYDVVVKEDEYTYTLEFDWSRGEDFGNPTVGWIEEEWDDTVWAAVSEWDCNEELFYTKRDAIEYVLQKHVQHTNIELEEYERLYDILMADESIDGVGWVGEKEIL